jgi:hypothetical protein
VRSPNGNLTILEVPGASLTQSLSINGNEVIAGYWSDPFGVVHGFIATLH